MQSPPLRGSRAGRLGFGFLIASFLLYAACFIYRTSFTIHGERYFSLFDDAMISMRYAHNFVRGHGLVWNIGRPAVEGYTNFLWVLFMAAIHLLPLPASRTALLVQISAAGLLAANLALVREAALWVADAGSEPVAFGAVGMTASYLPLNNWGLQGMEVSLLVLVMSACLCVALRSMQDGRFRAAPYAWLGASTLVRPDMAVPLIAWLLFHAVADPPRRVRHAAWALGALAVCGGLQTIFRLWYFGSALPNTYYLKMTGYPSLLRVSRGAVVLSGFIWRFGAVLFALPFVLVLRRDRRVGLLLWMFVVQVAYSVYVGGDAWEYWGGSNRYISIAMPAFFVVLSLALYRTAVALAQRLELTGTHRRRGILMAFAVLLGVTILQANSIYGFDAWKEVLLLRPPLHSGPGGENHDEVQEALALRELTTPDAILAVTRAGTIPYFTDRPGVDLLGKNDTVVAREPIAVPAGRERFWAFRPGHMKFDYRYAIEQQQPDVVVQLWHHREAILPYLHRFYTPVAVAGHCVYVRNSSPHVLWNKLPPPGCDEHGQ